MNPFPTWKILLCGFAKSDDHSSWIEINPYWGPLMHPIEFHNAPMITLLTSDYLSINYSLLSWANLWEDGPLCSHQARAFPCPSPLRINPTNHAILSSSIIQTDCTSVWNMQIRGEGTPTLVLSKMLWHLHLFKGTFKNVDTWARWDKKKSKNSLTLI